MKESLLKRKIPALISCLLCTIFLLSPFEPAFISHASPSSIDPGHYIGGYRSLYLYVQARVERFRFIREYQSLSDYKFAPFERSQLICAGISILFFALAFTAFILSVISLMRAMKRFWMWQIFCSSFTILGNLLFGMTIHYIRMFQSDLDPRPTERIIYEPVTFLYLAMGLALAVLLFSLIKLLWWKDKASVPFQRGSKKRRVLMSILIGILISILILVAEMPLKTYVKIGDIPDNHRRVELTLGGNRLVHTSATWRDPDPVEVRFGGVVFILFFFARLAVIDSVIDLTQKEI